jgi:hypothetical protein
MFEFLQNLSEWFTSGIYSFFEAAVAFFVVKLTVFYISMKLAGIKFAWGVAQIVLTNLNVFSTVQSAWSVIPPDVYSMMDFFNIPKAVNIILNAGATRFVLNLLPGF